MLDRRLIAAEVLKLRRRPGMLAVTLVLTFGVMAIVFVVMAIQHGSNPSEYGPAGGLGNYQNDLSTVGAMAFIVGSIVGATAGTQDLESGVFRDLVATGRSRMALFGARVAGAWVVVLPIVALTAALTAVAAVALAGPDPAPGAGDVLVGTLAVLVAGAFSTALGVGLSALVASRGPVIGLLLAFYLGVSPLLIGMRFLDAARQAVPEVAITRLGNLPPDGDVRVALVTAILVVLAWVALALGLGAWRTKTREI